MWNAKHWIDQFEKAARNKNHEMLHNLRREVFLDTVHDVHQGFYISAKGNRIVFGSNEAMQAESQLFQQELTGNWEKSEKNCTVTVIEEDTLVSAKQIQNPLVLNMANRHMPGGGVLGGAGAQEEYLFRCSNYFCSLYQFNDIGLSFDVPRRKESYPLDKNHGGVYSPFVTVFRGPESLGYPKLENPYQINCVAVSAISNPPLEKDETSHYWIEKSFIEPTKRKIRTIFRIALLHQHKNLVLGAFGCGAFKNPPNHMARLFREVLQEDEFDHCFEQLVFAILDNHNTHTWFNPEGNLKPFMQVFTAEERGN